jgi:outer membrane receptor for ferrienterochelin and colicin
MRPIWFAASLCTIVLACASSKGPAASKPDDPAGPEIFIDGLKTTRSEMDQLARDRIAKIEVIKGTAAALLYGVHGEHGLVEISTLEYQRRVSTQSTAPLYLIDGRVATLEEVKRLATDAIESIEVIKGPGALQYGADAQRGAILVTTKRRL